MKTIKEFTKYHKGLDGDWEEVYLLKEDVLGLIDEWFNTDCPTDHCRICNDCREELKKRINGT